ncbi:MAG: hypothetical protein HY841_09685 [Bacteroidetes bacterium]|nr:hypothetical protein [Bacteroidota bacterium]
MTTFNGIFRQTAFPALTTCTIGQQTTNTTFPNGTHICICSFLFFMVDEQMQKSVSILRTDRNKFSKMLHAQQKKIKTNQQTANTSDTTEKKKGSH